MVKIFISYRRADSNEESRIIYEALVTRFGEDNIFRDKDRIPKGADFRKVIEEYIFASDEMLVIIGEKWLDIREDSDPSKRRLDNRDDFVRIEISMGLRHVQQVTPVIIQNAPMPIKKELPHKIIQLGFKNAYFLRPNHFDSDLQKLVDDIANRHQEKSLMFAPIASGFFILSLIISGIFGLWQGVFVATNNPTPIPTQIVHFGTDAPTTTSTLTPPETLAIDLVVRTLDAEATIAQATVETNNTASVRATEFAVGTKSSFNQTATASEWTDTPTPNVTASIEAFRTQRAETETQAWVDSWTATASNTPSSTSTPLLTQIIPPTNTPVPTWTPLPTNTPTSTNTPNPTWTPEQTPQRPTSESTTTALPNTSTPNLTWTPVPTNTPTSTSTNTPTSTPRPPTLLIPSTIYSTPSSTWTPLPTTNSTVIASILLTDEALGTPPPVVTSDISSSSIGNGEIYPFYDREVDYLDTMLVELEIILDEIFITPTPIGGVTAIPANDDIPRPQVIPDNTQLTPRAAQAVEDVENISPYLIVELNCSDGAFNGCGEKSVRQIELRGINEWQWEIQAIAEETSSHVLTLVIYSAQENGTKTSNTPIWTYDFTVDIEHEFVLGTAIEDNLGQIIAGIFGVLTAIGGGLFAIWKIFINDKKVEPQKPSLDNVNIFISYRRENWSVSQQIKENLSILGADVFRDLEDIGAGRFDQYIMNGIEKCDYFIVVLSPKTLESEWVIKEIKYANDCKRIIIPLLIDGFDLYGDDITDDIKFIQNSNAIVIHPEHFQGAMSQLAKFMSPKSP